MDAARYSTPPPYQQKQNMVVIVQQQGDGTHQQTGDAGGQLTLASGLPLQYQQQPQQYQHNLQQQGFVAQLAASNQQQAVQQQQQQQYQVQPNMLGAQQTLQQQPQAYQGQYATPQAVDQRQLAQQHTQQQGALPAFVAAAGSAAAQQAVQRQSSANGTPIMRPSGGGAGIVRQEVSLPAGGSILAELDQLAAAVQVTPQQQQQQVPAPQHQQVPFQGAPQQQFQHHNQQGYVQQVQQQQQQQQPRQSWEQPLDLLPLQLQQQRDLTPQRMQSAPGSQAMQMQQTPAADPMMVSQQHAQTAQLVGQVLAQQQAQAQAQAQAQVQAAQHVQLAAMQPQQQQQHVVLQAVAVSGGNAAYTAAGAAQMQLPAHGSDGQGWVGGSEVKQQPQLQQQVQLQVQQLAAAPQQLQPQQVQQALQQHQQQQQQQQQADQQLLHNLIQLQAVGLPQGQLAQLQVQPQQQQQQQQGQQQQSPQCWGGPLAVIAQKPSGGSGQPGSPLAYLAGTQQVVLQPDQQQAQQMQQQQQQQQQQAMDVLAALQPTGASWDAQAMQVQQQQPQLHPQHLQQLQLTPQQQQQDQFMDLLMMQQQPQQQQQQQVVVVSAGMVPLPQQVAVRGPVAQLAPSPVPMQQQAMQQQVQQAQQQQQGAGGLMLPPAPRAPSAPVAGVVQQQQQQLQQQQNAGAVPPWRQMGGDVHPTSGITTAAIDREIPWAELQFGHQIGEGGFGKVYYGTWRGQAVAIKVLNPQSADSAKLMSEFNREVSTMTRLPEHPHVLKLLGVCTTPPNLALVTTFCAKGSLYGLLHSPGCYLSWVQVVAMLLDAARGMEHLHANSVLHRDLKSGNLLVDQDNMVRVADFGLSRLYHGMHTMTGGLGTFQWMAPEVLANQRYSNKADIYSFGMVMWECCARQVPFEGLNGVQAALAVMSRGMRPEIPQHTPAGLAALMQDCWAPVPEQRPGFDVVVARLQDLLQQLQHAEVTATAAAAANRAAAAITAAATGAPMNTSG